MFKKYIFFILILFNTKKCLFNDIAIDKLNFENIKTLEKKYKQQNIATKKFRKKFIIGTTITASSLLAFLIWHFKKDNKNNSNIISEETNTKSNNNQDLSPYVKKGFLKGSILDLTKLGIKHGIADGVYYALIGIIGPSIIYLQSDLFKSLKNNFLKKWTGAEKENSIRIINTLKACLDQLSIFFSKKEIYEKEEIVNYYSFYIEILENFIAISSHIIEKKYQQPKIIINLKDLIYKNVNNFSELLEKEINLTSKDSTESLNETFFKLENQIIRFINIVFSDVYEKDISF